MKLSPARVIALASIVLLPLAGCRAERVRPELLSPEAVTLEIPVVRQDELHACGLAAISSLCQYWGVAIPAEESAALSRLAVESEGLSGGELRAALERLGMEVFVFEGTLDRAPTGLYRHVDAGRPVLVMTSPGDETNHYCLVTGYDPTHGNLLLLDPVRGEVLAKTGTFERGWDRCRRFTLLSFPEESAKTGAGAAPGRAQ